MSQPVKDASVAGIQQPVHYSLVVLPAPQVVVAVSVPQSIMSIVQGRLDYENTPIVIQIYLRIDLIAMYARASMNIQTGVGA